MENVAIMFRDEKNINELLLFDVEIALNLNLERKREEKRKARNTQMKNI